jgi:NADH-quinone oxidoreductase subunit E
MRGVLGEQSMTFHPRIDYRDLHRSKRQMPVDDGKPFAYTPENRERLRGHRQALSVRTRRASLDDSPAVYLVRRQLGYVSLSAVQHVAGVIGCTPAEVKRRVVYTMFYTRPVRKYVVQVCRTLPCALPRRGCVTERADGRSRQGRAARIRRARSR